MGSLFSVPNQPSTVPSAMARRVVIDTVDLKKSKRFVRAFMSLLSAELRTNGYTVINNPDDQYFNLKVIIHDVVISVTLVSEITSHTRMAGVKKFKGFYNICVMPVGSDSPCTAQYSKYFEEPNATNGAAVDDDDNGVEDSVDDDDDGDYLESVPFNVMLNGIKAIRSEFSGTHD